MKWFLSTLVLTAIMAGTALAAEAERGQRGQRGQRPEGQQAQRGNYLQMLERAGVELTAEQKKKAEPIAKEMDKVMAGVREAEDRQAAFAAAREKMTELRGKIEALLTAEQKEKLEEWRKQMRERAPREGQERKGPPGGRPRRPAPKT